MYNFDEEIEKQRQKYDLQEAEVYCECNKCKREIYFGNEYYKTDFGNFCEECFDEIQIHEKMNAERIAGDDDGD